MSTWSSTWCVTAVGHRLTRWHLLGSAVVSWLACSWHWFAVLLRWPGADSAVRAIGWLTFPVGVLMTAVVTAVSLVLVFRRPDWRVLLAFAFAAAGGVLALVDLMNKLGGTEA